MIADWVIITLVIIGGIAAAAVITFCLLVLWVWFIWPAVEAFSMTRWHRACRKAYPDVFKRKSWLSSFIANYEPFGREWDRIRHRYGRWSGVGDWVVYRD